MSHDDPEWQIAVREQRRMFRLAKRDYGLTRKVIHLETKIPVTTLKSWENETIIPLTGIRKLVGVIPDDLTSLLFAETGKHIGTNPADEGDFDDLAEEADELARTVRRARSPKSPGGTNIVPIESAAIKDVGRKVCAKARAVAA